jgi:tetratricopeptide (TPR) repeat protein
MNDAADVVVKQRSLLLRLAIALAIFVALFGGAFLGSWQLRVHTAEEVETPEQGSEKVTTKPNKKDGAGGAPAELLARGDRNLQAYRYSEALANYAELLEHSAGSAAAVDYRVGLCNESLGQTDKALAAYRKSISAARTPALLLACQLGMARCLLQKNNPLEARRLLYPVMLDSAKQRGISGVLLSEARYLIGLSLARETHPAASERLSLDRFATFADAAFEPPFYLDEIVLAADVSKQAPKAAAPAPIVVQKRTATQAAMVIHLDQIAQPAQELLDKLVLDAGMRAEWTPPAKRQVEGRLLNLHLHDWIFQDLLEASADTLDLTCFLEGDLVRFSTREETEGAKSIARVRRMASRALQTAIDADAAHALAPAAYIEMGNADAQARRFKEAATWYERLIRETPSSSCTVLAYYNRAQLHMLKEAFPQARREFYRVIDQVPGHEFALRAYIRIGQHYIEEENTNEAITVLWRAQLLAPNSPYQPLATLNLAAAYISQGQWKLARATLDKHRIPLHQDPYKPTAAFLDAFARYKLAKAEGPARRETTELISILWHHKDATLLGPVGLYLLAQAYEELAFLDQAERLLRKASVSARKHACLAIGLDRKLGEVLLKLNQREKAEVLFEKIAATDSPHRVHANLHLARLHLADKRWKDCAEKCQQLWKDQTHPEPMVVLQLWGTALEGVGEYAKAARCFAGKAPE